MAASPGQPWPRAVGRSFCGGGSDQAVDLRDGQRGHPHVAGWLLVRPDRSKGPRVGVVAHSGGGDGADGQGRHDQHRVPGDRGIEADLGLVKAEAALAELEIFLPRASAVRWRGPGALARLRGPRARGSSGRPARRCAGAAGSASGIDGYWYADARGNYFLPGQGFAPGQVDDTWPFPPTGELSPLLQAGITCLAAVVPSPGGSGSRQAALTLQFSSTA